MLKDKILDFYSIEDFREWISELADPDTEKVARERICEGLSALRIGFIKKGDIEYFKKLIADNISQSKIKPFAELETDFLNALFQRWFSVEGQQMHRDIQRRCDSSKYSVEQYYEIFHVYFVDEISRNGGFEKKYDFYFDNEKLRSEVFNKLRSQDESKVKGFIECMRTLDGLMDNNGTVRDKYAYLKEPSRTYILYLIALSMISQDSLYGRENHKSLCQCFRSMYLYSELLTAGYSYIELDNCIDAYVVFSAYRYMMTHLPKRKQIVPGRKNKNI